MSSDPPIHQNARTASSTRRAIAIWWVMVLAVFFGPLDVSSDAAKMTVGLDAQVAVKLIVGGLATALGAFAVISSQSVRQSLTTMPSLAIAGILLLAGLATPIAISNTSFPTVLINLGYLAFVVTALLTIRLEGVATAILAGVTATMVVSLALYLAMPRYGVFPELLAGGLIVERLSGTAHPNTVGRAMMLGLILSLHKLRQGSLPTPTAILLVAGFSLTGYLAWSRMAIIAGLCGLMILYLDLIFSRVGILFASSTAMVGLILVALTFATSNEDQFVGKILSKISKTGDAEEITSGTGRAEIWAKATSLIAERPIIGHGFSAAPSLMLNHSQATHNVVLHATLAAGIGGGILMLGLMLWNLYLMTSCDYLLIRASSAFLIVGGLAEDAVLETFPGSCTLLWLACCIYPVLILQPMEASAALAPPARPAPP